MEEVREEWETAKEESTPDAMWRLWGGAARKVLDQVFRHGQLSADEAATAVRRRRMALLRERRELRARMVDATTDGVLCEVQHELAEITALLKAIRVDAEKARRAKLVEEIWAAHQRSDFSSMRKLRIQCQRNGRGPKKRYYMAARTHWQSAKGGRAGD
eukprot:1292516-Pyramimonas_sp.AAC.1